MYSRHRHRYESPSKPADIKLTLAKVVGAFSVYFVITVELTIWMLVSFAAVVYVAPPFVLPGLIVAIVGT